MIRFASLSAAMAALALTPAAMAQDDDEVEATIAAEPATPVKLISFDGEEQLLKKSNRMRIWRSHVAFKLTVDAEGEVTGCELTETFRRRYVTVQLCKLLSEHHTFEPARDASDNPVAGSYTSRISYMDLRNKY